MTTGAQVLTSTANPRVKAVASLRDRRQRDRTGLTLVDGARELRRALDAGAVIDEAFVCEALLGGEDARVALDSLVERGILVHSVAEAVLRKLAFGERLEGMVAVVRVPALDLDGIELPQDPLVVVLEAIEKPGNLGAVLRSVDGAGADALVAADSRTDLFNPNVIRASAGTAFGVPMGAASTAATLGWLRDRRLRVVAARVDAERRYTEADLTGPLAIALGAESDGLSAAWSDPSIEAVRLPMYGAADSLNVSVTAAVLLYEARRQRGEPGRTMYRRPEPTGRR
jgi:TrmH family RNA methyltransferase